MSRFVAAALAAAGLALAAGSAALAQTQAPIDEAAQEKAWNEAVLAARASLHPRGDFLAAEFEKEVLRAHLLHPGSFAVHSASFLVIHASQAPLARSRTRPI